METTTATTVIIRMTILNVRRRRRAKDIQAKPVFLYQSKTLQEQHVGYHAQHFAPFKVASFHIASKRANGSYAQTNQNQNDVGLQVHTEIIKRSSFAVCLAEQQRGM